MEKKRFLLFALFVCCCNLLSATNQMERQELLINIFCHFRNGKAISYKCNIDMIEKIPLPAIDFWNSNHFIVVYRVSTRYVWGR